MRARPFHFWLTTLFAQLRAGYHVENEVHPMVVAIWASGCKYIQRTTRVIHFVLTSCACSFLISFVIVFNPIAVFDPFEKSIFNGMFKVMFCSKKKYIQVYSTTHIVAGHSIEARTYKQTNRQTTKKTNNHANKQTNKAKQINKSLNNIIKTKINKLSTTN